MRLFHVSEEAQIERFVPRIPQRDDLDKNIGLVWAIDEARLPNYLLPRNCPRVTYHIGKNTNESDMKKFFSSPGHVHTVVVEGRWYKTIKKTTLYVYEFHTDDFVLQDDVAGYYVSTSVQVPKAKYTITDLFTELINRHVEIRIVDNLWPLAEEVKASTLNWSLCRMAYAQPKA